MASYTPAELSYLLAGRDSASAGFAREALGLVELNEGDEGVATGVQTLVSAGRAHVENGEVKISEEAMFIGYTLGTATDWLRVSIQTEKPEEGIASVAMAFVGSEPGAPALAVQVLPLGLVQFGIVEPTMTIAAGAVQLVEGYLGAYDTLAVAIQRDENGTESSLGFARGQGKPLRVLHRREVPEHADYADEAGENVDVAAVITQVRALVGAQ